MDLIRYVEGNWGTGWKFKFHSFLKLLSTTRLHFTKLSNGRKDSAVPLGRGEISHSFFLNHCGKYSQNSHQLFCLNDYSCYISSQSILFLKSFTCLLYFPSQFLSLPFSLLLCPSGKFHPFFLLPRIGGHSKFESHKTSVDAGTGKYCYIQM